jgi:hypothetical protein
MAIALALVMPLLFVAALAARRNAPVDTHNWRVGVASANKPSF